VILRDIVTRKEQVADGVTGEVVQQRKKLTGTELAEYLRYAVKKCVSTTLSIPEDEVDETVALPEMGMDSVLTVNFRMSLQQTLTVGVGSIHLTKQSWNYISSKTRQKYSTR
jgi:6-methylsalicylic acid synthase